MLTITWFGFLWTFLLGVFFFKNIKYTIALLLYSTIFQASAPFIVGTQSINPVLYTGVVLIIRYILTNRLNLKLSKSGRALIIFLLATIVISINAVINFQGIIILTEVNDLIEVPFNGETGLYRFIILIVYVLDFLIIWTVSEKINVIFFKKVFEWIVITVLIVGFWQYLMLFNIIPESTIFDRFIYSDFGKEINWEPYRARSVIRLFSTFTESSYCGAFLSAAFWAYFSEPIQIRKNKLLIFIGIELFLTFSTTAYLSFLIGGLIYLVLEKNYNAIKRIIPIFAAVIMVVLIPPVWNIVNPVIFDKLSSNSGVTRSAWNKMALQNFFDTYGLGIGFRVIRASSMFYNILGQLGFGGLILFINFILKLSKPIIKNLNTIEYGKFCILFLFTVIVAQLIACPDLDNNTLWLSFFICAIIQNNPNFVRINSSKREMEERQK